MFSPVGTPSAPPSPSKGNMSQTPPPAAPLEGNGVDPSVVKELKAKIVNLEYDASVKEERIAELVAKLAQAKTGE